jgi:hypothetical protein
MCFACQAAEEVVVKLEVKVGGDSPGKTMGMVEWLVQQLQILSKQNLVVGFKKVNASGVRPRIRCLWVFPADHCCVAYADYVCLMRTA